MKYILLLLVSVFFLACSQKVTPKPTPIPPPEVDEFTEHLSFVSDMIQAYSLSDTDLKKLQFYISEDIILYKEDRSHTSKIENGVLVLDSNSESNEFIIKAGTACVFEKIAGNSIYVHFENDLELEFKRLNDECCTSNCQYYLAADSWNNSIGTITIGITTYKALRSSGKSYLRINQKSLQDHKRNSLVIKGKKILIP